MAETERNKQTVARLFDAFRDGDVEAFDELIVEEFVQHNPHAVHSNYKTWNMAGVAIYRLNDDGKIIEHWDVLQQVPETTASGNDMFAQLT